MISELKGHIAQIGKDHIVIYLGGIGYEVRVPDSALSSFTKNEEIHIYTRLTVREDAWILYGFLKNEERTLFDLLRSVNGVGPRIALGVVSMMGVREFYDAVLRKDEKTLVKVPGIGAKTAGRIILELRDKIGLKAKKAASGSALPDNQGYLAEEALIALGYSLEEARGAVMAVMTDESETGDLESILKEALRRLARA